LEKKKKGSLSASEESKHLGREKRKEEETQGESLCRREGEKFILRPAEEKGGRGKSDRRGGGTALSGERARGLSARHIKERHYLLEARVRKAVFRTCLRKKRPDGEKKSDFAGCRLATGLFFSVRKGKEPERRPS